MSLARIALRMSAVEALRGKTLVEDNVLDSQISALDVGADGNTRTDQEAPFISVYTEGGLVDRPNGRASLLQPGHTDVLFEYGITTAMTEVDDATGESTVIQGIPATDAAFELYLDVVGRQIVNALTDPANEWAAIWRALSKDTHRIVRRRTSDAASGTRIAAHQLVVTLDLLQEPQKGAPRDAACPYMKFLAKLATKTDPASVKMTTVLRALIEPDTDDASAIWQRYFGQGMGVHDALGRGTGTWPSSVTAVIDSPFAPEPADE